MKFKIFTLKNTLIFIMLIFIYLGLTPSPKYNPKKASTLFKKELEEIEKDPVKKAKREEELRARKQVIRDRINTATTELEALHPNVEFDITNYSISAIIPLSLDYRYDVEILAKDIAIVGGENSILTKLWSYEHGSPKNIHITYNHYLNSGVPVTDITEYESGRYWNNNGFYYKALKTRVENK